MVRYLLSLMFLVTMLWSAASAHEFDRLNVVSYSKSGPYYEILIADTASGAFINCALLDAEGGLLATDVAVTNNLATKAIVNYSGSDVAKVTCVLE